MKPCCLVNICFMWFMFVYIFSMPTVISWPFSEIRHQVYPDSSYANSYTGDTVACSCLRSGAQQSLHLLSELSTFVTSPAAISLHTLLLISQARTQQELRFVISCRRLEASLCIAQHSLLQGSRVASTTQQEVAGHHFWGEQWHENQVLMKHVRCNYCCFGSNALSRAATWRLKRHGMGSKVLLYFCSMLDTVSAAFRQGFWFGETRCALLDDKPGVRQ